MTVIEASVEDRCRRTLEAVMVAGLLLRIVLMLPTFRRPIDDPDNYLPLAHSVAKGDGFVFNGRATAYRPPLYPLLLAPGFLAGDDAIRYWMISLHLMAAGLTIALVGRTARLWGLGRWGVITAAGLVAADPVLAGQARSAMTETIAALFVAWPLAALAGRIGFRQGLLCGLGLGLGGLCRPSLLPGAGLLVLALLANRSDPGRLRLATAYGLVLACGMTMLPWTIRNAILFQELVPTTTHGGYTMALANNPVYYDEVVNGPPGAVWSGQRQHEWFIAINQLAAGLPEPEADRVFARIGLQTSVERPRDFLRATILRVTHFWALSPSREVYPAWICRVTMVWTAAFWTFASLGLWMSRGRWPVSSAIALVVGLFLVHCVYWTDLRMRAPIVPALALIAAAGVSLGLHSLAHRPGNGVPSQAGPT